MECQSCIYLTPHTQACTRTLCLSIQASEDYVTQPRLIGWFRLGVFSVTGGLQQDGCINRIFCRCASESTLSLQRPVPSGGWRASRGRGDWRKKRCFSTFWSVGNGTCSDTVKTLQLSVNSLVNAEGLDVWTTTGCSMCMGRIVCHFAKISMLNGNVKKVLVVI